MAFGRLDVVVGIAADAFGLEIGRDPRGIGIHQAAHPERFVKLSRDNDHLVDIKRPTVIAGQPAHIGRVGDQQRVDAELIHALERAPYTVLIFYQFERQHCLDPLSDFCWARPWHGPRYPAIGLFRLRRSGSLSGWRHSLLLVRFRPSFERDFDHG